MSDRAALEKLRKEFGPLSDREKLELLRAQYGQAEPPTQEEQEPFSIKAPKAAWSTLTAIPAKVSETIDAYTLAPVRAGLGAAQTEREELAKKGETPDFFSPTALSAAYNQFGEAPSKAPTTSELLTRYGVTSPNKNISVPTIKNFASPNARFVENKVSPSDIAGGAIDFAVDPANMIPFGKAGHALQKTLASSAGATKALGKKGLKLGSQFLGQVKPDDFEYYVANHPRLKGKSYEGFEPIKQDILNDADVVRNNIQKAEIKVKETKQALETAKQNLQDKFNEGVKPSLEEVEIYQNLVNDDKAMQGYLSDQADQALAKLKIVVNTRDLKDLIQQEIDSIKTFTAPEASRRAVLEDVKNRLSDIGPRMNGPMLRDWMQSIRREFANFQLSPGVYDDELSKRAKNISESVSNMLKRQGEDGLPGSPPSEYRQIMNIMSKYSRASEDLAELFKTPQKGASTLKALNDGTPIISEDIEKKIRAYAKDAERPEVEEVLNARLESRNYANELKAKGPDSFLTKDVENYDWALHDLDEAKRKAQDISNLTEKGVDPVINNLSHSPTGLTSKPEYMQQIKNLEEMVPRPEGSLPYETQIRDQGVLKRFDQERPATGYITPAMTGIGGTIGTMLGEVPGSIVGTGVGFLTGSSLVKQGGKISRGLIDVSMPAGKALGFLQNKLQNPSPNFQKYMNMFEKSGNLGSKGLLLYHHLLWNNDPEYRKALTSEEP